MLLGDHDLDLFVAGERRRAWDVLGAVSAAGGGALGRVRATDSAPARGRPASARLDLPPGTVLWLAARRPTPA